jgi:hypothetical protein
LKPKTEPKVYAAKFFRATKIRQALFRGSASLRRNDAMMGRAGD